jgi:1-acyl-sn-glycerol-3-phosphate acyltransferase
VLRRLGGEPVDRDAPGGIVGTMVERFAAHEHYVLGIAPEGTRRRVARWRSGFHRIARGAGVPVVPVWLDYSRREVGIGAPVRLGSDAESDTARLRALYHSAMARFPALYAEGDEGDEGDAPAAATPDD